MIYQNILVNLLLLKNVILMPLMAFLTFRDMLEKIVKILIGDMLKKKNY